MTRGSDFSPHNIITAITSTSTQQPQYNKQHGSINPQYRRQRCHFLHRQLYFHLRPLPNRLGNAHRHLHLAILEHLLSPRHHPRSTTNNSPRTRLRPGRTNPLPRPTTRHPNDFPCAHGPSITGGARRPPRRDGIPAPQRHHAQTGTDFLGGRFHGVGNTAAIPAAGGESA